MERIVIKLTRQVKRHFRRTISKTKDAKLKTRYLIILHTAEGHSRRNIAKMLLCSPSTVDRVRRRFHEEGESGLIDRRGDICLHANESILEARFRDRIQGRIKKRALLTIRCRLLLRCLAVQPM